MSFKKQTNEHKYGSKDKRGSYKNLKQVLPFSRAFQFTQMEVRNFSRREKLKEM